MTRPGTHAEDCGSRFGLHIGGGCTCALAERQRIFDLERRVSAARELAYQSAKLPYYLGGGKDAGAHWQDALKAVAALLAAADEGEKP